MEPPVNNLNDTPVTPVQEPSNKRKRQPRSPISEGLDLNAILSTPRTPKPVVREEFFPYFSSDDEEQTTRTQKKRAISQIVVSPEEEEVPECDSEGSSTDSAVSFFVESEEEFEGLLILSSSRRPESPLPEERDGELEESTTAQEDFDAGVYWDPNQPGGAQNKDYAKSAEQYQKAALKLHPMALFRLGIFHETGVGSCNGGAKEAAEYYEKAGNAGLADGWNNLGALYLNKKLGVRYLNKKLGFRDSKAKAVKCFEKAISSANPCPSAHNNLGLCYEQDQNFDLARLLYHIGAEGGDPDAQYSLAVQYERGRGQDRDYFAVGIKQSYERAKYWYQRSLENPLNTSVEWAQYALGKLGLKSHIDGIDSQDERVIDLIKQAAKKKFTPAMIRYAEIKESDKPEKAFSLLEESTRLEPENGKAKYRLALCYLRGTGTEQNIEQGLKLLNEAVDKKYCLIKQREWNSIDGMVSPQNSFALLMKMKGNHPDNGQIYYELALRYLEGRGVNRSIKTGMQYFDKTVELNNCIFDAGKVLSIIKEAAEQKNLEATFELASINRNGDLGVVASADKAIKILSQAVLDHPRSGEAKYKLALYHFDGIGTVRNIKSTAKLLKDASIKGFQIRQEELLEKFSALKTQADETKEPKLLLETAWCLETGLGDWEEAIKYCREIIEIAQKSHLRAISKEATDIIYRIGSDLIDSSEDLIQEGHRLLLTAIQFG